MKERLMVDEAYRGRADDAAAAVPARRRVWFVTGASNGFGRSLVEAALASGDRVVATARRPKDITELVASLGAGVLGLALDVTDRDQVAAAVDKAIAQFGRIDVVVNCAGFSLDGSLDEIADGTVHRQLDAALLGPLLVTRAVLPHLRAQGHGHVIQLSAMHGETPSPGSLHSVGFGP
jgi:NAD(P)-dependent dehydrogenase (short-subunit alcohol dehydrogenase family)